MGALLTAAWILRLPILRAWDVQPARAGASSAVGEFLKQLDATLPKRVRSTAVEEPDDDF